MSVLDFVRPDGQWANEMVPGANDFQRFDIGQSKGINGDGGGTYAPASPIFIGGFDAFSLTTAASQFEGGVSTETGGRVQLDTGYGSNQPVLASPLGRTIVIPLHDMVSPTGDFGAGNSWLMDDDVAVSDAPGPFGAQSIISLGHATFIPIPSRYLHQGSSFSKLRLHFRVPTKPPTNALLPSIAFALWVFNPATQSIYQYAPEPSTWAPSTGYGTGAYVVPEAAHTNGYYYKCTVPGTSDTNASIFDGVTTIGQTVSDTDGVQWTCMGLSGQLPQVGLDAATYYNNGAAQVLELDFDNATGALLTQNQVDHGTYSYGILVGGIGDDSGTVASVNAILHTVEIEMVNIVDLRFE